MLLRMLTIINDTITSDKLEHKLKHYIKLQTIHNKQAKERTERTVKEQHAKCRIELSKRYAKYLTKYSFTKEEDDAYDSMMADLDPNYDKVKERTERAQKDQEFRRSMELYLTKEQDEAYADLDPNLNKTKESTERVLKELQTKRRIELSKLSKCYAKYLTK